MKRLLHRRHLPLLVSAAVLVLCSAPAFLRPFLNDDASYALVGAKLSRGAVLYRDAVDNKPPLIYFTFAAVFRALGAYSLGAVKALTIAVNVATAALVMRVGTALLGGATGGVAAVFYAAAVVSGVAEDSIAPNTESYMNLCVMLGLAVLVRRRPRPSLAELAGFGALVAVATAYRLQAVLVLPGAAVYLALGRRAATGGSWRGALAPLAGDLAVVAAGFALPLAALAAAFAAHGAVGDLWAWAIADNFFYIGAGSAHGEWARKAGLIGATLASQLPLVVPCLAGLFMLRRASADERRALWTLVALLAGALYAFQLGGRFYGHYFLQAAPFVCLIGAWAFARRPERLRWIMRPLPALIGVWCLGFAIVNVVRLSRPRPRPGFAEAAAYIRASTAPADEVLLWGGAPELLLDSGRVFGTRFINNNAMTGRIWGTIHVRPEATPKSNRPFERPWAWELFWRDMNGATPRVIVDGTVPHFEIEHYPRLAAFVAQRYLPPASFGVLRVYLLRDAR
jgi:hypothetical protein